MKAFISYSTALDQIIALRIQTNAAVYGVTSYVPPAPTRNPRQLELAEEVLRHLRKADVVLAVITHTPTPSAEREIEWAMQHGRLLIPIIGPGASVPHYLVGVNAFSVDPADPSQTTHAIVNFLADKHQADTAKTAVLALATLTIALLLFGAKSK